VFPPQRDLKKRGGPKTFKKREGKGENSPKNPKRGAREHPPQRERGFQTNPWEGGNPKRGKK